MKNIDESIYEMDQPACNIQKAASIIGHGLISGRNKLFQYLRYKGIFNGTLPKPEYIGKGLFMIWSAKNSPTSREVSQVVVTSKGLKFIKNLLFKEFGHTLKLDEMNRSAVLLYSTINIKSEKVQDEILVILLKFSGAWKELKEPNNNFNIIKSWIQRNLWN